MFSGLIWLWRALFPTRDVDSDAEMERYHVARAADVSGFDNDKPIYLLGATLAVILAIAAYLLWRGRVGRAARALPTRPQLSRAVQNRAGFHFLVAAAVILLPVTGDRLDRIEPAQADIARRGGGSSSSSFFPCRCR